jgi:hypothetical protein
MLKRPAVKCGAGRRLSRPGGAENSALYYARHFCQVQVQVQVQVCFTSVDGQVQPLEVWHWAIAFCQRVRDSSAKWNISHLEHYLSLFVAFRQVLRLSRSTAFRCRMAKCGFATAHSSLHPLPLLASDRFTLRAFYTTSMQEISTHWSIRLRHGLISHASSMKRPRWHRNKTHAPAQFSSKQHRQPLNQGPNTGIMRLRYLYTGPRTRLTKNRAHDIP